MNQTPLGNISVKPRPGRSFRRHLRLEQAARLETSGQFSNNEIAEILGIKVITLHQIKATPEYLSKRAELMTGVISDLSNGLRAETENIRAEIQDMLPTALRTLRNAVSRGAIEGAPVQDIKVGMDAAREIMDREGTFAKVSKSEIKVKEVPNFREQEATEMDLLTMLQNAQAVKDGKTEQTISLDSFINSAGEKESQERMKNFIKLADFESPNVQ